MAVQASVHLDPKDMARINKVMRALSPKLNGDIWRDGLTRMALLTQKEAQTEIKQGRGKSAAPLATRLTGRTNALVRSLEPDFSEIPKLSSVGTALKYGAVHETGGKKLIRAHSRRIKSGKSFRVKAHTANFPRRPYLEPGLNSASKRYADIMVSVLAAELRKAGATL